MNKCCLCGKINEYILDKEDKEEYICGDCFYGREYYADDRNNLKMLTREQEYYARMNDCNDQLVKTKQELEKTRQERNKIAMQVRNEWMEKCNRLLKERDRVMEDMAKKDREYSQTLVWREDVEVNAKRAEKAEGELAKAKRELETYRSQFFVMERNHQEEIEKLECKLNIKDFNRDELLEKTKELERTQSICHCGIECSKHTMGDGHSAVEMEQECYAEYALDKLQAVLFDKDAFLQLEKVDTENKKETAQKQEKVVERMLLEVNRLKFVQKWYYELLYAVSKKFQGESRHETALRYINEREKPVYLSQTFCDGKIKEEVNRPVDPSSIYG